MASNIYNLNTWSAKRIIGDTATANNALIETGADVTTDIWILHRTNRTTDIYGIKYFYDYDSNRETPLGAEDRIELYGGYKENNIDRPTAWVQLDTGDTYIKGKVGINYNPITMTNEQLYVNGATTITGITLITNNTTSTDAATGALVVTGGAGFNENVNINGQVGIGTVIDSERIEGGIAFLTVKNYIKLVSDVTDINDTITYNDIIHLQYDSISDEGQIYPEDDTKGSIGLIDNRWKDIFVYHSINLSDEVSNSGNDILTISTDTTNGSNVILSSSTDTVTHTILLNTKVTDDTILTLTNIGSNSTNSIITLLSDTPQILLNSNVSNAINWSINNSQSIFTIEDINSSEVYLQGKKATYAKGWEFYPRLYINTAIAANQNDTRYNFYVNGTSYFYDDATHNGIVKIINTTGASSTTTGALQVSGGISTQDDLHIGKNLHLYRNSNKDYGRIYFYSTYKTWSIYMSDAANQACPSGGKPSTLNDVTNWALRSYIENLSGYGWIWESAAESNTGTPTAVMALNANNGNLTTTGHLYLDDSKNIFMKYGSTYYPILENYADKNIGLNAATGDLRIGYKNTTATHMYYSTDASTRTEFFQINSNGAYALTRFGVNGQNTNYTLYTNGTGYFTNHVYIGRTASAHLYLINKNWTKGTNPSSQTYSAIEYNSNDSSNNRVALLEATLDTSGNSRFNIYLIPNIANSTSWSGIVLTKTNTDVLTVSIAGSTSVTGSVYASTNITAGTYVYAGTYLQAKTHVYSDTGHFYMKYNNAWYSVLYNHNNGNISLNAASTGLYIGYTNTTFVNWMNGCMELRDGCLSLFPNNSSYREGIRIHATGSWSDITLCGNDNTGNSGTSANSWFIGNNNGNFYISRNGSSSSSSAILSCVSNVWSWNGTATGNISGNAATATALTSNAGGTEQPIYFTGGKPAATSYALKATVNNGTAGRLSYYSGDRTISATTNAHVLNNYLISSSRNGTSVDIRANGLIIWGQTYGNTANQMISNTAGVFRFGDGGPQIVFNTSNSWNAQAGALIFTDNDTAGAGTSFHFVSTENSNNNGGNCTVTAPRFRARAGLTVGQNSDNTSYNFYLNGSGYLNSGYFYIGAAGGVLNGAATNGGLNSIRIGDDVWLGDCNAGGIMGMKSTGTSCGFYMYNSSGTQIGQLYFNGTNLYCNKTIEHPDASVSYIAGAKGSGAALYAKKTYNVDHWYPAVALETKGGGAWQIGNYNDETLEFQYATKANRDSDTNTLSEIYMQNGDTGRVMTSGNYTNWTVTKTGSGASGNWGISITGNAATATNADKVDNYHAADLWRKDGGTWNGNANISCTPTANNQEYSFDLGSAYTGTYWHVWSGKNSKSILVCYNDNMNVSVPNGTLSAHAFSGPLTGNVTGNCSGSSGSCTGNAATATKLAHTTLNSTTINNTAGSFAFSGSGAPWDGSDWVGLQIGDSVDKFQISANGNTLVFRQNDSGGTNTSWSSWVTMLTSSNYTSYTVTKTGSGASGTWGISVTGHAGSLWVRSSLTKGTNPSATTWTGPTSFCYQTGSGTAVADRIAGGIESYINANGLSALRLIAYRFTSGSSDTNLIEIRCAKDGTCTYSVSSPANFRSAIGVGASGTHADSYFALASHDHTRCGVAASWLYFNNSNEVNFGGTNTSATIYFGYRATDSRPQPTEFVFGKSGAYAKITCGTLNATGHIYLGAAAKHLYMNYNSTNYAVVFNHNNGNVSLRACGGGLFIGYADTTSLNFMDGKATINSSGTFTTSSTVYANKVWANQGTSETQVAVDHATAGNLYLYSNGTNKGLYSGNGYKASTTIIKIDSGGVNFYGTLSGNATGVLGTGNVTVRTSNASSYVQLQTTSRVLRLQADGNLVVYEGSTAKWSAGTGSSRLIKQNICTISDSEINKFMKIRPVSFIYRPEMGYENILRYGVIAEELLLIYPNLVDIPNNYSDEKFDIKKGLCQPLITVKYDQFIPLLIKMVQNQQKEIEQLRNQINKRD